MAARPPVPLLRPLDCAPAQLPTRCPACPSDALLAPPQVVYDISIDPASDAITVVDRARRISYPATVGEQSAAQRAVDLFFLLKMHVAHAARGWLSWSLAWGFLWGQRAATPGRCGRHFLPVSCEQSCKCPIPSGRYLHHNPAASLVLWPYS